MGFFDVFDQTSKSIKEKNKKALKDLPKEESLKKEKELKEKHFWSVLSVSIAKYITKSLANSIGSIDSQAHQLSILNNQGSGVINRGPRFNPISEGGPTEEKIYNSALNLVRRLSTQEVINKTKIKDPIITPYNKVPAEPISSEDKSDFTMPYSPETGIPTLITNKLRFELRFFGVTDEEIDKLNPSQAWNLLQQKNVEKELKESNKERSFSINEINSDFSTMQSLWDKAYEDMDNVSDGQSLKEIMDLTAQSADPVILEEYIKNKGQKLLPEEKFFIEISIQLKKFKNTAKEVVASKLDKNEKLHDINF